MTSVKEVLRPLITALLKAHPVPGGITPVGALVGLPGVNQKAIAYAVNGYVTLKGILRAVQETPLNVALATTPLNPPGGAGHGPPGRGGPGHPPPPPRPAIVLQPDPQLTPNQFQIVGTGFTQDGGVTITITVEARDTASGHTDTSSDPRHTEANKPGGGFSEPLYVHTTPGKITKYTATAVDDVSHVLTPPVGTTA
jgi:hypothetical protein